ncbi:MAG: hypothetical protein Q8P18_20070 [Pseudomonadota bacterium]|nr:hypothetical protein [Pseudomonadota bacterium]
MWVIFLVSACSPTPVAPAPAPPPPAVVAEPSSDAGRAAPERKPRDLPPAIQSITLAPTEVRVADPLRATVKAVDVEGADLDLDYEWLINDSALVDVTGERLGAGRHKKGDTIRVRVTADDGANEVMSESDPVVVLNTAPVFSTRGGDMKRVDGFVFKATDADDDTLTWRLEGAPGGMSISPTGQLSYAGTADEAGGRYTVAVIVGDGDAWGRFEFPLTVTAGSKGSAPAK